MWEDDRSAITYNIKTTMFEKHTLYILPMRKKFQAHFSIVNSRWSEFPFSLMLQMIHVQLSRVLCLVSRLKSLAYYTLLAHAKSL